MKPRTTSRPPRVPAPAPAPQAAAAGRGRLLIVATPIGNLGDLPARARAALDGADLVACEDTRRSGLLLHGLGIKKPLLSLHEHNERQRLPQVLGALAAGKTVALVSDAGTPLVSDPGFLLVREAVASGATVEAIPGPSAVLAALVVSGLPAIPFTFAGFPPPKSGRRRAFYRSLAALPHTLVIFESPHRLLPSLEDALAEFGERPASLSRELTKLHEETQRGGLAQLRDSVRQRSRLKGEFVLVIGPPPAPNTSERCVEDGADGPGAR